MHAIIGICRPFPRIGPFIARPYFFLWLDIQIHLCDSICIPPTASSLQSLLCSLSVFIFYSYSIIEPSS